MLHQLKCDPAPQKLVSGSKLASNIYHPKMTGRSFQEEGSLMQSSCVRQKTCESCSPKSPAGTRIVDRGVCKMCTGPIYCDSGRNTATTIVARLPIMFFLVIEVGLSAQHRISQKSTAAHSTHQTTAAHSTCGSHTSWCQTQKTSAHTAHTNGTDGMIPKFSYTTFPKRI